MIAAIPAEDRPTIIVQRIPERLLVAAGYDLDAWAERNMGIRRRPSQTCAEFRELLLQELELHTHRTRAGVRCLSCGAQTDAEGQLPCGH